MSSRLGKRLRLLSSLKDDYTDLSFCVIFKSSALNLKLGFPRVADEVWPEGRGAELVNSYGPLGT